MARSSVVSDVNYLQVLKQYYVKERQIFPKNGYNEG